MPKHDARSCKRTVKALDSLREAIAGREEQFTLVTDRLRDSCAELYVVLDAIEQAVLLLGPEGSIRIMNKKACDILGLSREEALGSNWFARFVPERLRPELKSQFDAQVGRRDQVEFWYNEHQVNTACGQELTLAWQCAYLPDAEGEVKSFLLTGNDITDRKKAEAALREEEDRFLTFIQKNHGLIYQYSMDGNPIFLHGAVEKITGYMPEEFLGGRLEWRSIVHQEDVSRVSMLEQVLAAIPNYTCERDYRIVRKDGTIRWVHEFLQNVTGDSKNPVIVQGALYDVTERKEVEKKLSESQDRLKAIFENAVDGIILVDEGGNFVDANPAARALFGLEREKLSVGSLADIPCLNFLLEEKQETYGERQFDRDDGTRVEIDCRWVENIVPGLHMAVVRDVTEKNLLEKQLIQSQKMEAVGRLAGGIAHDFNNLLTAIIGYAELLKTEDLEEAGKGAYIEEIRRAADRAASLTRQLLAYSRKQILQPKVFDPNSFIRDMQSMLRRLISEDIDLVLKFDPALWEIYTDEGQMVQVIMNLVINAQDAMSDGGTLAIETKNATFDASRIRKPADIPYGDYVLISVSDTGTGMDEATKRHIFEPFFTTKEIGKGTGLGLATVYGIVRQSGGCITFETEKGKGTTFFVYLPRAPRAQGFTVDRQAPREREMRTGRILVVEDDARVRRMMCATLRSRGHKVCVARNGNEALEFLDRRKAAERPAGDRTSVDGNHEDLRPDGRILRGRVDLVITDLVMPHMGGLSLCEAITRRYPDIKLLAISGYSGDFMTRAADLEGGKTGGPGTIHPTALAAGYRTCDCPGIPFLQKPFTPQTLLETIDKILHTCDRELRSRIP